MTKKETKDKEEEKKPDITSENTCPICEGQGCECAASEKKKIPRMIWEN